MKSRVNREVQARFWERPGVRFPRATRHPRAIVESSGLESRATDTSEKPDIRSRTTANKVNADAPAYSLDLRGLAKRGRYRCRRTSGLVVVFVLARLPSSREKCKPDRIGLVPDSSTSSIAEAPGASATSEVSSGGSSIDQAASSPGTGPPAEFASGRGIAPFSCALRPRGQTTRI